MNCRFRWCAGCIIRSAVEIRRSYAVWPLAVGPTNCGVIFIPQIVRTQCSAQPPKQNLKEAKACISRHETKLQAHAHRTAGTASFSFPNGWHEGYMKSSPTILAWKQQTKPSRLKCYSRLLTRELKPGEGPGCDPRCAQGSSTFGYFHLPCRCCADVQQGLLRFILSLKGLCSKWGSEHEGSPC